MEQLRHAGLCLACAVVCAVLLAGCADRLSPLERMRKDAHERHEEFVKRNREEAERSRQRMEEYARDGSR